VGIRGRDCDEGHVQRHGAAFEKLFDFAQVNRSIVGATGIDRLADVRANEHRIVAEVTCHLRRNIGS
jgi:hypothetical protein